MPDFFIEGLADQVLGSEWRHAAPPLPAKVKRAASPFIHPQLLSDENASAIRASFAGEEPLPHVCLGSPLQPAVADDVHHALERAAFAPHHHDEYQVQIARRAAQDESAFTQLVDWLDSDDAALFHFWLVGEPHRRPNFIQVQTSRAVAGDYFPPHVDNTSEGLAVIYNLTRDWQPKFGGVLRYLDDEDRAFIEVPPSFHQVFICRPADARHEVSRIEKAAGKRRRYSITAFYLHEPDEKPRQRNR